MLPLALLVPGNVGHRSGGTVYNEALALRAARAGRRVVLVPVPGPWPTRDRAATARVLAAARGFRQVLVDGLIGTLLPGALTELRARGVRTGLLVHLPERFGGRAQAGALAAADVVVVTSAWTGHWLLTHAWPLTGRPATELTRKMTVAVPGTGRIAEDDHEDGHEGGHGPGNELVCTRGDERGEPGRDDGRTPVRGGVTSGPVIACVAALTPNKNQLTLLRALTGLTDLRWTAWLVGSARADPRWARLVTAAAAPLGDRVEVMGELSGAALAARWARIDLLVLPSTWESWGMVVTESLARGVPAVVGARTGAVDALAGPRRSGAWRGLPAGAGTSVGSSEAAGAVVPGDDARAIAATLRRWLRDGTTRRCWADAARSTDPPGWGPPTDAVLAAMTGPRSRGRPLPRHGPRSAHPNPRKER